MEELTRSADVPAPAMTAVSSDDRLQDGIYFRRGQTPGRSYRLLLLNVNEGTTSEQARDAIEAVWKMLQELRCGIVQELPSAPPVPNGALTCLLGFGARLFEHAPTLTPHGPRPEALERLPRDGNAVPFPKLPWAPPEAQSEGEADLALQFIAETELAVNRAVAEVWKSVSDPDHPLPLRIVTFHGGFNRDDKRSWLGFHDGISNIRPGERRQVIEVPDQVPPWMQGGTYMACLRLAIDLAAWRRLPRAHQESLVGREKMSGCPLEAIAPGPQPVPLQGCPGGTNPPGSPKYIDPDPPPPDQLLLMASHIHRANVNRNLPAGDRRSHRIFRQGYEFLEPGAGGQLRFGLNFVSFQRSLGHLKYILTNNIWLGGVNFGGRNNPAPGEPRPLAFLSVIAGGFYAVPPTGDPFPGADIF